MDDIFEVLANIAPSLVNIVPILIIVGFLSSLYDKRKKVKKLLNTIKGEPIKYSNYPKNQSIHTNSKKIYSNIIKILILFSLIEMVVFFLTKRQNYYLFSVLAIFLYLILIEYTPYNIKIEEGKFIYKHLINTLNKTIEIPIGIIEDISYFKYSEREKKLSLYINLDTLININLSFLSNVDGVIDELNKYMCYRKKVENINYEDKNEKIKVRGSSGYIFILLELIVFEVVIIYSFFYGYHDIVTISAIIIFPIIAEIMHPYKLYLENNTIKYKHFLFTFNKLKEINIKDINNIFITSEKIQVRYSSFNIYKLIIAKQNSLITIPLYFNNIADAVKMLNCVKFKMNL